jgi:hypothetical protein
MGTWWGWRRGLRGWDRCTLPVRPLVPVGLSPAPDARTRACPARALSSRAKRGTSRPPFAAIVPHPREARDFAAFACDHRGAPARSTGPLGLHSRLIRHFRAQSCLKRQRGMEPLLHPSLHLRSVLPDQLPLCTPSPVTRRVTVPCEAVPSAPAGSGVPCAARDYRASVTGTVRVPAVPAMRAK